MVMRNLRKKSEGEGETRDPKRAIGVSANEDSTTSYAFYAWHWTMGCVVSVSIHQD
jgi:hypothetical protein